MAKAKQSEEKREYLEAVASGVRGVSVPAVFKREGPAGSSCYSWGKALLLNAAASVKTATNEAVFGDKLVPVSIVGEDRSKLQSQSGNTAQCGCDNQQRTACRSALSVYWD